MNGFSPKKDLRTPHEKWCDAMIKKSKRPIKTVTGVPSRNKRSNYELKKLFEGAL